MNRKTKITALLALASVSFFWGTTYFAIRIGVKDAPPYFFAGFRNVVAGILILLFFLFRDKKLPPINDLLKASIPGFFMILLSNGFVSYAEQSVPSGLTALLCSFVPFLVVGINVGILKKEKLKWSISTGLLLGILGLGIIFYDNVVGITDPKYLIGIVLIILANISWASGSLISKNLQTKTAPLLSAGIQMFTAGLGQIFVSLLLDGAPDISGFTNETWLALIYLIVFGSIIGYGSYIYALTHLPTTVATLYAYINPIVAVFLGWALLNENVNLGTIIASLLTLLGVYLVNKGYAQNK